eukprot:scaffold101935_cov62-Phaeocystis_antarctica.AAC.5
MFGTPDTVSVPLPANARRLDHLMTTMYSAYWSVFTQNKFHLVERASSYPLLSSEVNEAATASSSPRGGGVEG